MIEGRATGCTFRQTTEISSLFRMAWMRAITSSAQVAMKTSGEARLC